jgi:hypothetical protein
MAHPSYSRMRAMRQTADQYRETASQHLRTFGYEERQQRRLLPVNSVWFSGSGELSPINTNTPAAPLHVARTLATAALADDIDRLLEQNALQSLSICNKAGLVTAGAAKIEKVLGSAPVAALLHATDGSADGIRKMGQLVTRTKGDAAAKLPRVTLFASSQLDLALGRSNVIHAALKSGAASEAFLERCRRLALYRGATGGNSPLESEENLGSGVVDGPVEAGADDRN